MYIKEVIIDGFKSYAHRTVVEGFHPHFNAITGLNGSGKSNILDSICFVLGITNLSQVRAGNLSELVYKQGQAGVHKASVTILFNNEDESTSPVGYEQCPEFTVTRQVLVGGRSKYLINGRVAPAGQVNNLFHSVQLNVNNPHFLIMQGRITKVLNMKPVEILGMVEEAAGTRMYETKKNAAIKTIDKKQNKLDELNTILAEEITPTLERLRGEKHHYLKWSKNNADIERIERFVVAGEFQRAKDVLDTNAEEITEMEAKVKSKQEKVVTCQTQISNKENEILDLTSKLNGEIDLSHKKEKTAEENFSKELVKASSAWKNCKTVVENAQKDVISAKSLVVEGKESLLLKETEIAKDALKIDSSKKLAEDCKKELASIQEEYQNMLLAEGDGGESLPEQISNAHNDANSADARAKQSKMKIDHITKTMKCLQKDLKKEENASKKLAEKRNLSQAKVTDIRSKLSRTKFSEAEFDSIEREKLHLENSTSVLEDTIERLTAQLQGRLTFKYSDPVRGFDRNKVKGLVARLVDIKDPVHATALEVAAGGKLYQVVVDEAITGKALLSHGKLQRRVTIIPLDKISSRRVTTAACKQASSIAGRHGTTASPAIELVGFDEEVRSAVEYVFGSTIIVDGMDAANKICDTTRTRTVTLEGDVYDPSGTISGGSNKDLGTTLAKLSELTAAKKTLTDKQSRQKTILSKWKDMSAVSLTHCKLSDELEIANAEFEASEKHMSQTSYGMLAAKIDTFTKDVEESKVEMKNMEEEKRVKWKQYEELMEQEVELTQNRELKLKKVEKSMNDAKKRSAAATKKIQEADSISQTLLLELENLKSEVAAADEAVFAAEKALNEANVDESAMEGKVDKCRDLHENAKVLLAKVEEEIARCSSAMKTISKEKSKLVKEKENAELDGKKLAIKIAKFHKEKSTAERFITNMLKTHEWIETEKHAFGVEGGDYDFGKTDHSERKNNLQDLKKEQNMLAKNINKKVMGMIEKAEGEYTELLRKRKVVENDKKKIQAVIEELDVKKKTELERTWIKVNRDFGSVFSTLLPGASAKLEPPEGKKSWEGLEVKVAFGDVWKQSLSELSGGQRSLLALSLILSLLLFKPAPMYILDEVDAALDLSHTQNIGNMLKTHFSQSQFIVVSLKEGMFNNANVIFRTKFVDGVSTVSRTLGTNSSNDKVHALTDAANGFSAGLAPARKRLATNRRKGAGKEN
eukprot:CAMPEP_0194379542 /NCGR_PEP_ID=MMETSP0174-20130528/40110_1 /TAXON_ID=216777 /ORGANISM="Proboscia alata, Strain PI-D3" /LENGTH=1211 /DNA_ID=CAMNT_0039162339 /DNA_START=84 /DNA_END=3719 /DNA_ORIENTATION=-